MNKFFQLTLLTAMLSAGSSHAVIRSTKKFIVKLIPLVTSTHLKTVNPIIPSQRCFQRKKPPRFVAEVVKQYTFRDEKDAQKILTKAHLEGATEIHWYEKE